MPQHLFPHMKSYGFTGHETFPFRLGWLHKGVMEVKKDNTIFSKDDAIVSLGVGKNMVRSIRHWCVALGLITDKDKPRGVYEPTPLGLLIFDADGEDPYLEDIGTLWWLHWKLANHSSRCTTWYFAFNHLNRPEFSKSGLKEELVRAIEESGGKSPSEKTIERDIECFIRTYTAPRRASEEFLECPLVELNILKDYDENIRLSRGEKATLPDHIFLAGLVEFYSESGLKSGSKALSAERIMHTEGSPGRVFVLDDNSCTQRLERLNELTNGRIVYDSTAGMRQVFFHSVWSSEEILQSYYQRGTLA